MEEIEIRGFDKMIPFLKMFNKKADPEIGQRWRFIDERDPWDDSGFVTILDIKDGWVKYKIETVPGYERISTLKMKIFKKLYDLSDPLGSYES